MQLFSKGRMWRCHNLRSSYDVVIIGAGAHGLAAAYYLGKNTVFARSRSLRRAIWEPVQWSQNCILRSNYRTPEGISFYDASLKLTNGCRVSWNGTFSSAQCGHLTLAHNDSSVAGLHVRAENNQLLGVNSRVIDLDEISDLAPSLSLSRETVTQLSQPYIIRRAASSGMMP